MITRYLEHFTQDEVDKAPGDTLTVDLPYGGNRPYVIGTILRDHANGEYILWNKGTEKHRLCIEHSPNEFVEWKVVTEDVLPLVSIGLQQLTRDYPFGKIKRVGMIPLNAEPGGLPSSYYDRVTCISTDEAVQNPYEPANWFGLTINECELTLNQTTELEKPTYCELDALLYRPFFTDKVYFSNLNFGISQRTGVVLYCVYELNDGVLYYPLTDLSQNNTVTPNYHSLPEIPFLHGYLRYVCINRGFDASSESDGYHVHLIVHNNILRTGGGYDTVRVWEQGHNPGSHVCFFNTSPLNYKFSYGTFVYIGGVANYTKNRSYDAYLRFTSEMFNS